MKETHDNTRKIAQFAINQGMSLFGVADISGIKGEFNLEEKTAVRFDLAISMGKRLVDAVIEDIKNQPTPLYMHHYRQLNFFLDRGAFRTASYIQNLGFQALPIPASQILDWEKQTSHVSHKKIAYLAGLGWLGRNNLLVNPFFGARFRLVTILTDMPLVPEKPLDKDCGSCKGCTVVCPANAIKEKPEDFDHIACFAKLKDFRRRHIVSQYICGVCVKACRGSKQSGKSASVSEVKSQ